MAQSNPKRERLVQILEQGNKIMKNIPRTVNVPMMEKIRKAEKKSLKKID